MSVYEIINWGSDNLFEALGILEEVKFEYRKTVEEVEAEEAQDQENE